MRRLRVVLAAVLTLAFAASAGASCLAEASSADEMACCSGGQDKCPMKHDDAQNCCRMSAGRSQQASTFTVEKVRTARTPALIASELVQPAATHIPHDVRRASFARALSRAPSPPPHLLATALLI